MLNFATINMCFSAIMIIVGLWDIYLGIASPDTGRWNEDSWYAVADVVSILLALETVIIHLKFPDLVFT